MSSENPITREKTLNLLSLIDSAIQSTRRIQSELRPTVLDDLGLLAAIKWQTNEFQKRTGIKCDLDLPSSKPPLQPAVRLALFRILQETLTNVARHSEAKNVTVFFSTTQNTVTLIVSDDGKGIEPEQTRSAGKYGIRGILERVHYLGGEVKITGKTGKGTSLTVTIPISSQPIKRRSTDIVTL
jgi:signal transduction histidine kinase